MEITEPVTTDYRDYTQATPFDRFIARFIDRLLGFFFGVAIGAVISIVNETAGIIAGFGAFILYLFLKDTLPFLNGQSIGKKAMNLLVVDANEGTGITGKYLKGFGREITTIIPLVSLIDAIMIFGSNRRLGDDIAGTIVVNLPRR